MPGGMTGGVEYEAMGMYLELPGRDEFIPDGSRHDS